MNKFAIARIQNDLSKSLNMVLDGISRPPASGESVFLKPNFTYPFFKAGVTTTREVLEALIVSLKNRGCDKITIGEGDGGYNSFSMDGTFANFRLEEFVGKYGVQIVNTSRWPSLQLEVSARRGRFSVSVPRPVFEEFDRFISIPVPKVHAMTTISGAIKNLWGLVQDSMRLHYHVAFDEIISAIAQRLPGAIAVVDGVYGLTRNGPMIEGLPLELGWVAACDNLWLNDRLMCDLMNMPMAKVEHLIWAQRSGFIPVVEESFVPSNFNEFKDKRFYLRRNFWNYVAKSTWYSRRWNHFVYFGKLSNLLHKMMYAIRTKPKELSVKGVNWK